MIMVVLLFLFNSRDSLSLVLDVSSLLAVRVRTILDLDGDVINFEFFLAHFGHFREDIHALVFTFASDVSAECVFANTDRPQMEVMNSGDILNSLHSTDELVLVNILGSTLH